MSEESTVIIGIKEFFSAKLADLEAKLTVKADERDLRYAAMFTSRDTAIAAALAAQEKATATATLVSEKAVNAALAAQEKAVLVATESSEKAIQKAEVAQMGVNERGNEFRKSLDDYVKITMPRVEADSRFREIKDMVEKQALLIEELRRSESRGEGTEGSIAASRQQSNWVIALIVSTVIGVGTIIVTYLLVNHKQ